MLIGLTGKAQSGKDTTGLYLCQKYGYQRLALADKVKDIARSTFGWDGNKDEKGRRLLQLIGTEVGRAYNPGIWVKHLSEHVSNFRMYHNAYNIVVTDVRFQNEADFIKKSNGVVWRLTGRGGLSNTGGTHPSEVEQDSIQVDATLDNSGDFNHLYAQIDKLMAEHVVPDIQVVTNHVESMGIEADDTIPLAKLKERIAYVERVAEDCKVITPADENILVSIYLSDSYEDERPSRQLRFSMKRKETPEEAQRRFEHEKARRKEQEIRQLQQYEQLRKLFDDKKGATNGA